jgi:hypothetical protein
MNGHGYYRDRGDTSHLRPGGTRRYASPYEDEGRRVFARQDDLTQVDDRSALGAFGKQTLNQGFEQANRVTDPFSFQRPFRRPRDIYDEEVERTAQQAQGAEQFAASQQRRGSSLFGTALGLAANFIPGGGAVTSGVNHVIGG